MVYVPDLYNETTLRGVISAMDYELLFCKLTQVRSVPLLRVRLFSLAALPAVALLRTNAVPRMNYSLLAVFLAQEQPGFARGLSSVWQCGHMPEGCEPCSALS